MKKAKLTTKCVANQYAGPSERIIEFSFPDGSGGLISFLPANGARKNRVDVYRIDKSVKVLVGKAD